MPKTFLPELLNFARAKGSKIPMDPEDFRKLRKAAGLTQTQMAQRIGVTRLTILNWEGAKFRIPYDIMDTLVEKGLGVPVVQPKNAKLTKATVEAYREMRRDGVAHFYIVKRWHEANFVPTPEAQAQILAEWPELKTKS